MTALLCEKAMSGTFLCYTALNSLTINELHFPAFSHVVQLVSTFPRLGNISLLDLTWDQVDPTQTQENAGSFSYLHHLFLSGSAVFFKLILDWLARHDLPMLDHVSVMLSKSDARPSDHILPFLAKLVPKHVQIGPLAHPSSIPLCRFVLSFPHTWF
jgi:hypothetical protein